MTDSPATAGQPTLTRLARAFVWVAVPTLLFVHLFVTFRGLSGAPGMEQAQLARELARGHGFHTLFIRPYAWRQALDHGRETSVLEMRDTFSPPLQPLLLAPVFKAFEPFWGFDKDRSVYVMDRVVAAIGLLFFLGSAGLAWGLARRLFDENVAGWTFVTILACQFLWDVARSGLPQMQALFFFTFALDQFSRGLQRDVEGRSALGPACLAGIAGALLVLTHWMGLWLVLGLAAAVAWQLRPRVTCTALVLLPAMAALAAWGLRNQAVCGDLFGSLKATTQAALTLGSDTWLLRDFSAKSPPASAGFLMKKISTNLCAQVQDIYGHLGAMLPAALFFLALLHPFRRPDVRRLAYCLGLIWLSAAFGMALIGLPLKESDPGQVHVLFLPVAAIFGFAFLAVLRGRLAAQLPHPGWWSRHGLAAAACALSALPMLTTLPTELTQGLGAKGEFAHWPPYLPRQIHKIASYANSNEIVLTDIPWAVAWYADRTAAWLPIERRQFDEMRDLASQQGVGIAGFLMTPESLRAGRTAGIFTGEYRDWTRLAMRGIGAGLGVDLMAQDNFPYREFLPLAAQPGAEPGRFAAEMVFMSGHRRWESPSDTGAGKHAAAASAR